MCMGVDGNSECTFCHIEKENIQHLFWHCTVTYSFWTEFESDLNEKCSTVKDLRLNEQLVIFGCDKYVRTDDVFDLLLLLAKKYIYTCKMTKDLPLYTHFLAILKNRYYIEKHIAAVNMKSLEFRNAWLPYTTLLRL